MGRTSNSFKGQIGRDAGKVVSNLLFGDKHATPHRHIIANSKKQIAEDESNHRIDIENKNQMFGLDSVVLQNIDLVAGIKIPHEKLELIDLLSELTTQLSANKWDQIFDEENRIRNKFTDALFDKYKQCVFSLEAIDPATAQLAYYKSVVKKGNLRKIFGKFSPIIGILALFLVLTLIVILNPDKQTEQTEPANQLIEKVKNALHN